MNEITVISNDGRYQELKRMLEDRRREIVQEVERGKKKVGQKLDADERRPEMDRPVDIVQDISLMLLEMKSETLAQINAALQRLQDRKYGVCKECNVEISEQRLRAWPFAVRCKDCEASRELPKPRVRVPGWDYVQENP
jgi:DnaK suppressor protein